MTNIPRKYDTAVVVCMQEASEDGPSLRIDERFTTRHTKLLSQAFTADTLVSALSNPNVAVRLYYTDSPETSAAVQTIIHYLRSRVGKENGSVLASGRFEELELPAVSWGSKIAQAFKESFEAGFKKVVFLGSRSPTVTVDMLQQAIDALDKYDTVSGPTVEGRYYLLGMRGSYHTDLEQYDWSDPDIYSKLADRFTREGLNWTELPIWYVVENPEDLDYLVRDINQFRLEGDELTGHETEKALQRIIPELEEAEK